MNIEAELYALKYKLGQQLESYKNLELRCDCGEIELSDSDKRAVQELLQERVKAQIGKAMIRKDWRAQQSSTPPTEEPET